MKRAANDWPLCSSPARTPLHGVPKLPKSHSHVALLGAYWSKSKLQFCEARSFRAVLTRRF